MSRRGASAGRRLVAVFAVTVLVPALALAVLAWGSVLTTDVLDFDAQRNADLRRAFWRAHGEDSPVWIDKAYSGGLHEIVRIGDVPAHVPARRRVAVAGVRRGNAGHQRRERRRSGHHLRRRISRATDRGSGNRTGRSSRPSSHLAPDASTAACQVPKCLSAARQSG